MRRRPFDRGRWQTHRERCHIEDYAPPDVCAEATSVGAVMPSVLSSLKVREADWSDDLETRWIELAGPEIARHIRPGRIRDGRLVLFADSSVWLSEVRSFRSRPLLAALQAAFGADRVRSLTVEPDPDLHRTV